jgi:hypothetical protein
MCSLQDEIVDVKLRQLAQNWPLETTFIASYTYELTEYRPATTEEGVLNTEVEESILPRSTSFATNKREHIARCIDSHENERDAPDSTMEVNTPIMPQNACWKKECWYDAQENEWLFEVFLHCFLVSSQQCFSLKSDWTHLQSENQSSFNSTKQSSNTDHKGCAFGHTPFLLKSLSSFSPLPPPPQTTNTNPHPNPKQNPSKRRRANIIIKPTLSPRLQTQQRQYLRLHLERNIKVTRDIICAERDASADPEEHHAALEIEGVVAAMIEDLGEQLRVYVSGWVRKGW